MGQIWVIDPTDQGAATVAACLTYLTPTLHRIPAVKQHGPVEFKLACGAKSLNVGIFDQNAKSQ